jgi:hypothetical protein
MAAARAFHAHEIVLEPATAKIARERRSRGAPAPVHSSVSQAREREPDRISATRRLVPSTVKYDCLTFPRVIERKLDETNGKY